MEKEIYLDFNGVVGFPVVNPLEIIKMKKRTLLKFSFGMIDMPEWTPIQEIPEMENNYATLVSYDNTKVIELSCGQFEESSYNWGDPLPNRFHIKSLHINGKDLTWKYIDPWYPWVKYTWEEIAFALYDIYQKEAGRISA